MPQFWAPIGPRDPRIAGSAGSVVTPLVYAYICYTASNEIKDCSSPSLVERRSYAVAADFVTSKY